MMEDNGKIRIFSYFVGNVVDVLQIDWLDGVRESDSTKHEGTQETEKRKLEVHGNSYRKTE